MKIPLIKTGTLQWEQGFPVLKTGFSPWELTYREFSVSLTGFGFTVWYGFLWPPRKISVCVSLAYRNNFFHNDPPFEFIWIFFIQRGEPLWKKWFLWAKETHPDILCGGIRNPYKFQNQYGARCDAELCRLCFKQISKCNKKWWNSFLYTGGPHISWFLVPKGYHEMQGSWIPRTVFSVNP